MKKIVVILIAVTMLFTACNSNSASSSKHDFRDVDFGMSTIELFEIEGEPDDELSSDDRVTYSYNNKEAFGVKNVNLKYWVDKNGVVLAYAIFQNEYADNKSYITEYNTVKKNLIAALGEPESIVEDETEFNFRCTWENQLLTLNRNSNDSVFFQVVAHSPNFTPPKLTGEQNSETSE